MDKKEAILKSVLKLVNREGFYHLNMKKIAAESNIAAGTIYLYFKGKEELINALYNMIITEFNSKVLEGYNKMRGVKDNFFEMMGNAIEFYLEDTKQFSFIEQYTYAPFLFKENQDENFTLLLPIFKMMKEGKKKTEVKQIPDAFLLSIIHGAMSTIIKLHLAHKIDMNKKSNKTKFIESVWESIANN